MEDIYNHLKLLTRFELIYKDSENVPHCLRSYVKRMDEDKILIAPPSYHDKTVNLPDHQEFKMIICAEDGVYSAKSKVIGKEISTTPGVWINYPLNSQRCQRREYLRAPLDIDFDLVIYKDSAKTQKDVIRTKIRDISGKGVSFFTDSPLSDYYDIACVIHLKDEKQEPITLSCEHIYTHPSGNQKYINALAFIDIDEKDSERIIKQCFKYQLEQRREEKNKH